MKKDYIKPAMRVVKLQHRYHILTSSPSAKVQGIKSNSEGIIWKEGGFADGEGDM